MKAALDAGHGARPGRPHTGAAANGLAEDDVALDLVKRIGHHLRAAGHETFYTRSDERLVPLAGRAKIARDAHCDVFLSIHCNSGPPSASGVEAFAAESDNRSLALAQRLVEAVADCGMRNRGAKWDSQSAHSRLAVLRGTYKKMPAVLLEVGFLTSPHDSKLLRDRWFLDAAAKAIARTL